MLRHIYPDDPLGPQQEKNLISKLLDAMLEKMEKAGQLSKNDKEKILDNKDNLIENILKEIKGQNSNEIKLQDLQKDSFLKNIFVNCIIGIFTEKHMGLDKVDKLQKDLKQKNILNPKDIKKAMDPDAYKKLLEDMKKCLEDIQKALKLGDPKKEPTPKHDKKGDKVDDEANINLLGLVNPGISGCLEAIVQVALGNLYGIPDQNPYNGNAQIDEPNKIDDTQLGDPLGLNASAITEFLKQSAFSDDLVTEMQQALRTPPSPQPPGGGTPQ